MLERSLTRELGKALSRPSVGWMAASRVFSNPDLVELILSSVLNLRSVLVAARASCAFRTASEATRRSWEILVDSGGSMHGRDACFAETGFYFHRHVAALPCGALCVPDVNNRCLRVLSPDGAMLATLLHADMRAPRGPVVVGSRLYAVEAGGHGIHCVSLEGRGRTLRCERNDFRCTAPEHGWPTILQPDCCAASSFAGGSLYVSCAGNDLVLVLRAGSLLARHGSQLSHHAQIHGPSTGERPTFNRPQGLAAHDDALWVCDAGNCRVCVFSNGGATFDRAFGRYGHAPGEFSEPRGLALLPAARALLLLVVESSRMQVVTAAEGEPLQVFAPETADRRMAGLWGVCVQEAQGTSAEAAESSDAPSEPPPGLEGRRAYVVNSVGNRCHVLNIQRSRLEALRHRCD